MELTHEGDQTLRERVELLREHRENVIARIAEMQRYLEKITWKVNFFSGKLETWKAENGKTEQSVFSVWSA